MESSNDLSDIIIELTKETRSSVQPIGKSLEPYEIENQKKQFLEIIK